MVEAGRGLLAPSVNEVLETLTSVAKVGICTSASRSSLEFFLSLVSKSIKFDVLLCSDNVKNAKPDPEIYLRGVSELGLEANKVLVVEDSIAGIQAGLSAGCQVAQVNPFQNNSPKAIRSRFFFQSLQELLPDDQNEEFRYS
jgi:HAD superfamily hydrolase (TIGR01509 family)